MARKKVASEPVLRDWAAVDTALRDLKECQYALTELGVELDRRIDSLKDDYNKNAQPLQNHIKRLEGDVKEYVTRTVQSWTEKAGRWYSARWDTAHPAG